MLNSGSMRGLLMLAGLILAPCVIAQEVNLTLQATVTGNREQPRVMYMVPWQSPAQHDVDYAPAAAMAADLFRPINRREFQRELVLFRQTQGVGADGQPESMILVK